MASQEDSPVEGIRDIDTFVGYIDSYRKAVMAREQEAIDQDPVFKQDMVELRPQIAKILQLPDDVIPPLSASMYENLLAALRGVGRKETKRQHEQSIGEDKEGEFIAEVLSPPSPRSVFIRECSWEETPDSLRELLLNQYPAAQLPGQKHVDVSVRSTGIELNLKSDYTDGEKDHYAGYTIHGGVRLGLEDTLTIRKGEWRMSRFPSDLLYSVVSKLASGEEISDEEREVGEFKRLPASLGQLKDLTVMLERFKDKAREEGRNP